MPSVTRRLFLNNLAGAGVAASLGLRPGTAAAQARNIYEAGNPNGGGAFGPFYPQEISVTNSRDSDNCMRVQEFRFNGRIYGRAGGRDRASLFLGQEEYITYVNVRHSHGFFSNPLSQRPPLVDRFWVRTNTGNEIMSRGFCNASRELAKGDLRVCMIRGRAGARLDYLEFEVIEGYRPSSLVEGSEWVLLDHFNPDSVYQESTVDEDRFVETHSRSMTRQTTRQLDVGAGIEFTAAVMSIKPSLNTSYSVQETTFSSVATEIARLSRTETTRTEMMGPDTHGFLVARCQVMTDRTGTYFVRPIEQARFVKRKRENFADLNGVINLVSGIEFVEGLGLRGDFKIGDLQRLTAT